MRNIFLCPIKIGKFLFGKVYGLRLLASCSTVSGRTLKSFFSVSEIYKNKSSACRKYINTREQKCIKNRENKNDLH